MKTSDRVAVMLANGARFDEQARLELRLIDYVIRTDPDSGRTTTDLKIDNPMLELYAVENPESFAEALEFIASALRKAAAMSAEDERLGGAVRPVIHAELLKRAQAAR